MFELSGKVKLVLEEQTFGSGFNKREFVLTTTADRYPQDIKFETVKEKTSMLDGLSEGDEVTVSFDVRGREWKGNYYVNLNAWKVVSGGGSKSESSDGPPLDHYDNNAEAEEEDVPF
ncbi:DUF3127 domain-containing protein [Cerasicoccus arenae]|uniref:DUF3127 domain-containing protein n=1 Tax=Cerasicoccus arenae TaxID=424488 RepID=A0A8J3GDL5_9BACT|nr:DUF3127 domain-containing protein [Cerasicoccus arenae]MBK1858770.1 DUF3127 domain-containing protein [Cerasicoccus arenae]GHC07365.1 hypothetical protein GCM10007047_25640 [Cerasicoccus arenae]